jgi:hypothetical protein
MCTGEATLDQASASCQLSATSYWLLDERWCRLQNRNEAAPLSPLPDIRLNEVIP